MADREKLIELLENGKRCPEVTDCDNCPYHDKDYWDYCHEAPATADMLIANGVTIQEWIPVTERLPQEGEHPWITCEVVQVLLNDGAVTVGYCNRGQKLWYHLPLAHTFFVGNSYEKTPVVAWQPLAEHPKGE